MDEHTTTQTPAQNEAIRETQGGPARTGIDWINLMLISEHSQEPAEKGAAPTWIFRIELDTVLTDAQASDIRSALVGGRPSDARATLLTARGTNPPTSVKDAIDAAFSDLSTSPPPSPTPSSEPEVALHVVEDFGRGAKSREAARAQMSVSLTQGTVDQLRRDAESNRQDAKDTLERQVGAGTKTRRARRIVDATLD